MAGWSYSARMDFSVLGPLRVSNGADPVEVRGAKERTLLAHLIASSGRMVPTSDLIDSLWGEQPPRSAAKSLQTYVLRLRNALEPGRNGSPTVLVTEGPGYRLVMERSAVDAERFAALVALGRRALADGRAEAAAATLSDALDLWRGPAYAGFEATTFGRAEARRLSDMRLAALEDRCAAELELGKSSAVVPELERLLGEYPLSERLWSLLVLGLYRSGRQGDALAAYDRAREVLAEQLGVDPGPELRELHGRVLAQDPKLAAPRRAPSLPPGLAETADPMVGRDSELSALREAWRQAQAGGSVTVFLRGPKGAGATRLAAALAQEVVHSGGVVVLLDGDDQGRPARTDVPTLLVADHVEPPRIGGSTLLLVLAGAQASTSEAARVIDLRPLDGEAVRAVVGQYVDAVAVESVTREVVAATRGWPGAVHAAAVNHARNAAVRRVEAAAQLTDRSSAALASARADLTEGVVALNETVRRVPAGDTGMCPWRGLAWYDVGDAAWFAGRERLVAELVSRLAGTRFLGVVGASGGGKSSAVRAGLLAALADDVLPGSGTWDRILMRPGDHPMRELARVAIGTRLQDVGDLLEQMIRSQTSAVDSRTVLVVDQLEEAWTACQDPGERAAFLDTLAELASDPRSPVTVVLVVRADYVGELADHPALARGMADSTVLVGAPTPAEVRRAIERPAARAGLTLDDGLAEAMVSDAGAEPGLLPLLSTALTRLWLQREGARLTFAAYVGMGGLSGAIAHLADAAYNSLSTDEQVAARTLLLRLTGPGEGTAVTRRRVPLSELEALPRGEVRRVVDVLADARLLTVSDGHVEVAHEALFREWPRLRGWLVEDAAGRSVQRRLALAASEWDADGREPGQLWRGTRLVSGLEVAEARPEEVTTTEREFLDAGRAAVDAEQREAEERAASTARQNRRLRGLLGGLAVLLVVALVAGYLATRSRAEAEEARLAAEGARVSAEAKRLAASALNEEYLDRAVLAAVEAVQMEESAETLGALVTLLARNPAVITQVRTPHRFLRASVSPDGGTVYVGENERVVRALDAETGESRWTAATEVQPLAIAGGAEGVLVAGGADVGGAVTLLDPRTGQTKWTFGADEVAKALGPDARHVVAAGTGWLPDGRAVAMTESHVVMLDPDGSVSDVQAWGRTFWPDFVQVWPDGRVSLFDGSRPWLYDPLHPRRGLVPLPGLVQGPPAGGLAVVATGRDLERSRFRLYDTTTWRPVRDLSRQSVFNTSATFSRDGSLVALPAEESVAVYDVASGDVAEEFTGGHSGTVMASVFAGPQDDRLWTAGRDGTAMAWDLSGERGFLSQRPFPLAGMRGDVAPGGDTAVVLTPPPDMFLQGGDLHLIDSRTGETLAGPLEEPAPCPCWMLAFDMSQDGGTVGVVYETEEEQSTDPTADYVPGQTYLSTYDVSSGRLRRTSEVPWPAYGLALDEGADRAVVNGVDGFGVFDVGEGRVLSSVRAEETGFFPEITQSAELSPDGSRAVVGRPGRVVLLDMATGEVVSRRRLTDDSLAQTFLWTRDGTIVAGADSGRLHFLSGEDLAVVAPPRMTVAGWVNDLAASHDGSRVASLGSDGDVLLWDPVTWRPLGTPVTEENGWGLLAFDPERPVLRAFHEFGQMFEVSVDADDWLRRACQIAHRDLTREEWAVLRPGVPLGSTCGRT